MPSDSSAELPPSSPTGRLDVRAVPHLTGDADLVPEALPTDAVRRRRALEAVSEALSRVPLSLEAVRAAAVRFGHLARDAGLGPDDMAAALGAQVRRVARAGTVDVAQLAASVAWWGAHGYHRAD